MEKKFLKKDEKLKASQDALHIENVAPLLRDHLFSTSTKFSEKVKFLTPWYAHVHVRIRG